MEVTPIHLEDSPTPLFKATHDLKWVWTIVLNNGMDDSSGCMGDTSLNISLARKRKKTQYNTAKLSQPDKTRQLPRIQTRHLKKLWIARDENERQEGGTRGGKFVHSSPRAVSKLPRASTPAMRHFRTHRVYVAILSTHWQQCLCRHVEYMHSRAKTTLLEPPKRRRPDAQTKTEKGGKAISPSVKTWDNRPFSATWL